jgi:S-adenosylmethionine hydrolase
MGGVLSDPAPITTITMDFGLRDYFVAAMKGVILSVNPDAKLIEPIECWPCRSN